MSLSTRSRLVVIGAAACAAAAGIAPALTAAHAASTPGWRIFRTFAPHRFKNLIGLAVTGAHDAWAFGDGPRHPFAVHWDGTRWTGRILPGANARPEQASSTSRTNVWASGHRCFEGPPEPSGESAYISRWNGRGWTTTHMKTTPFCSTSLVTTGPHEGWLFGFSQAIHLTRGHRTLMSIVRGGQIVTATSSGTRNVWAFGAGPGRNGFARRWSGHRWRSMPAPALHLAAGESFDPEASRAVSANDVWLCGAIFPKHLPVLLNWNGTNWRRIPVPGHVRLPAITTDGHGGVWMLGLTTGGTYSFLHYAHGTVTSQPIPTNGLPGFTSRGSFDMYAIGRVPGTTSVWATGDVSYSDAQDHLHAFTLIFKFGQ